MKLKTDPKNPRRVLDENGDEMFVFTGMYLDDLRLIITKTNYFSTLANSKEIREFKEKIDL